MSKVSRAFLASDEIVDWQHPGVFERARTLGRDRQDVVAVARDCYQWVRDHIPHTVDAGLDAVSCSASDVLRLGTGYCYAKSHLLAALLRANGIPAGLCYQRLSLDGRGAPFCLHGLNAVHLPRIGWYRIDARGNKPGIEAAFAPPAERLAFSTALRGECGFAAILPRPPGVVVEALRRHSSAGRLNENLPDAERIDV